MVLLAYALGDSHCQIPAKAVDNKALDNFLGSSTKIRKHAELPDLRLDCVNVENRAAPSNKHKKASTLGAERNVRKPVTGITKKIDVLSEQNEKVLFLLASRRQCSEIKQVKKKKRQCSEISIV